MKKVIPILKNKYLLTVITLSVWVVFFDKYRNHQYGAVASTDLKNWQDVSDKISLPKGIRHGTIFTISQAEFNTLTQALLTP